MVNILIHDWKTYVFLAYMGIFFAWALWENHKAASLEWLPNTAVLFRQLDERARWAMNHAGRLLCPELHHHEVHWRIQNRQSMDRERKTRITRLA